MHGKSGVGSEKIRTYATMTTVLPPAHTYCRNAHAVGNA